MTTPTDATIAALRAVHDDLAHRVAGLTDAQLGAQSGAAEWSVADVLSHLGSGAEIGLASLTAAASGTDTPAPGFNEQVWARWNALNPREQAVGFVEHDARLVAAYEALTARQREQLDVELGFLPAPLPVGALAGMRLNESAQHAWDIRVADDADARLDDDSARLLVEHLAGDLAFLVGFLGTPDALATPAVIAIAGTEVGITVGEGVAVTMPVADPTATFVGPLESAVRLIGGRLGPAHTPAGVEIDGDVTLDDLRRVFRGF